MNFADKQNALALKYQADYGRARRDSDLLDPMDQAFIKSVGCVFGPGFLEKLTDLRSVNVTTAGDNAADALLVSKSTI